MCTRLDLNYRIKCSLLGDMGKYIHLQFGKQILLLLDWSSKWMKGVISNEPRKYQFVPKFMKRRGGIHDFISAVRRVDTDVELGKKTDVFLRDWINFLLIIRDLKRLNIYGNVFSNKMAGVNAILSQLSSNLWFSSAEGQTAEVAARNKWFGSSVSHPGTNSCSGSGKPHLTKVNRLCVTSIKDQSHDKQYDIEWCHQANNQCKECNDNFSFYSLLRANQIQTNNISW